MRTRFANTAQHADAFFCYPRHLYCKRLANKHVWNGAKSWKAERTDGLQATEWNVMNAFKRRGVCHFSIRILSCVGICWWFQNVWGRRHSLKLKFGISLPGRVGVCGFQFKNFHNFGFHLKILAIFHQFQSENQKKGLRPKIYAKFHEIRCESTKIAKKQFLLTNSRAISTIFRSPIPRFAL